MLDEFPALGRLDFFEQALAYLAAYRVRAFLVAQSLNQIDKGPLAHQLERVASLRRGSKSALLEEALRKSLEPEQVPGVEEGLVRRLNELHKALAAMARDVTVATETLALFVRYMLTVTPPIPDGDQESARLTGRKRYDVFLTEVGKRVAGNGVYTAEVLRTVPVDQPDLFATPQGGPAHAQSGSQALPRQRLGVGTKGGRPCLISPPMPGARRRRDAPPSPRPALTIRAATPSLFSTCRRPTMPDAPSAGSTSVRRAMVPTPTPGASSSGSRRRPTGRWSCCPRSCPRPRR